MPPRAAQRHARFMALQLDPDICHKTSHLPFPNGAKYLMGFGRLLLIMGEKAALARCYFGFLGAAS